MRQKWPGIFFLGSFLLLFLFVTETVWKAGRAVFSAKRLLSVISENQTGNFEKSLISWERDFSRLKDRLELINSFYSSSFKKNLFDTGKIDLIERINFFIPEFTGREGEKIYFFLLQNNREIRATGGFLGSYAKIKFKNGGLVDISFQDIYVPDGQLQGHVDPPAPIQEAFKQGFWRLRDANWDPNFPETAKVITWFFKEGGEDKVDGIIALNFLTIQKIINIIGEIPLDDYNLRVNSENLYQILQSQSQDDFFPGSTQKRDIITSLGKRLVFKLKTLGTKGLIKVATTLYKDLEEKQIYLYFKSSGLESIAKQMNWNGAMPRLPVSSANYLNDYLYLVESNLGVNKANCCLSRRVNLQVDFSAISKIEQKLTIIYQNLSFLEENRVKFWGGDYQNYLRVYFPVSAEIEEVKVGGKKLPPAALYFEKKESLGLRGVGFFVKVESGSEKEIVFRFSRKIEKPIEEEKYYYRLLVQKQPGIVSYPFGLIISKDQKELSSLEVALYGDKDFIVSFLYNRPTE